MVNKKYQISDELWERIKPLLPPTPSNRCNTYISQRDIMEAVFCVLHKGCKLEEIPVNSGSGSSVYHHIQEWLKTGVFDRMWQVGIITFDELMIIVQLGTG